MTPSGRKRKAISEAHRRRKGRSEYYQAIKRSQLLETGTGKPVACGKLCHASRSVAKSAIRRNVGSGKPQKPGVFQAYYCPKCSAWHIGHARQPELAPRSTPPAPGRDQPPRSQPSTAGGLK